MSGTITILEEQKLDVSQPIDEQAIGAETKEAQQERKSPMNDIEHEQKPQTTELPTEQTKAPGGSSARTDAANARRRQKARR